MELKTMAQLNSPAFDPRECQEARKILERLYSQVFTSGEKPKKWLSEAQLRESSTHLIKADEADDEPLKKYRRLVYWQKHDQEHLRLTLRSMLAEPPAFQYGQWHNYIGSESPCDQETPAPERVLLLLMGFSTDQLALSVAAHIEHGCRKIFPVTEPRCYTEMVGRVQNALGKMGYRHEHDFNWGKPVSIDDKDNGPAAVFKKVAGWLWDHQRDNYMPAIDCTGGKKPMDAGASRAASYHGVPVYYVDFDEYDPDLGLPKPHTCRYRKLELPDAVFSLSLRQDIRSAYRDCDFGRASALADTVMDSARRVKRLDPDEAEQWKAEVDDIKRIQEGSVRSHHWMELAYHEQDLTDYELHGEIDTKKHPRVLLNEMLEDPDTILPYIVDEYWRLRLLFENRKQAREAQIGIVGLVELVMNAILFLSRICGEWKLVKILPVNLASITHVPPECLLRNSDANSRVQLLRGLKGGFAISVAKPEPGQTKLRPGNKLDATVVLKIDRAPVKQPPDQESLWADSWGGYGDGETPEWVNLRHALAHMRTPLFATDDLKNAINIYAPRFIELLFRLKDHGHADITDSDQDDWITWWDNPRWKESARLPWLRDKLDISNLLHLPPDQTRDS